MTVTPTEPSKEDTLYERFESHVVMLHGVVEKLRATMGRELPKPTSEHDIERHKKLSDTLFEVADNTIYLAEDILADVRRLGLSDETEQGPASTERAERLPGKSENELLRILMASGDKPMKADEIVSAGFRPDLQDTTRRKIISETARSLEQLLMEQHGIQTVIGTGNTRARVYSLESTIRESIAIDAPAAASKPEAAESVDTELPEHHVVVAPQEIEIAVHDGVTKVLSENDKLIISIRQIIHKAFDGTLDPKNYTRVTRILKEHPSLNSIGEGEYAVKGRDISAEWIDTKALEGIVEKAVAELAQNPSSSLLIREVIAKQARTGNYMTQPERTALKAIFSQKGHISGDVFTPKYEQ